MSSDMIRVTGLNSGLDTESIISAYTSTATKRVKDAKDSLQMNKWTQEAWSSLNSKIYGFYSKTLSTNRMSSAYSKQKTTTSDSALSVVPGAGSVNGVQNAKIVDTASAAFLTGGKISASSLSDNLADTLGIEEGKQISYTDNDGNTKTIQIGGTSDDSDVKVVNSMNELVNAFKSVGLNANFDTNNQRIFLSAKSTGESYNFTLGGDTETLAKLGLATGSQLSSLANASDYSEATEVKGTSAKLILNGAEFSSDTNSFSINGSTYTINHKPTNPDTNISITTQTDYDGVYDVIKNMLKEYNELVNEMSKAYNAESSKGYKPLTDEQKDQMSEKEIDEWNDKIKSALLRKDETVYDVMNELVNSVSGGIEIDGKTMYLSDFGISTLGYFEAEENERYALHIDGDLSDDKTASKDDKLKGLIASDPETVSKFFSKLSQTMYTNLYSKMGTSQYSSIYKVYNDKQLKTEQSDWEKKITDLEDKLSDMEDKYYKKFASMEKMLATINSKQSAVSSYLGM